MHRFFLTQPGLQPAQTVDLEPIAHQLQVVLRLQPGAQIVLLDGQGRAYLAEITTLQRRVATGYISRQLPDPPEPTLRLTLYQCSLKADKFEWILQKGTELGVARFVPVISERSVVRPAAALQKKYERWQAIIREAAEQCGRGRIPRLQEPLTWAEAITHADGLRLLPWEAATQSAPRLAPLLLAGTPPPVGLSLLIGPEGGISDNEAATAQTAGWQTISLGPQILRAETAALAAVAVALGITTANLLPAEQPVHRSQKADEDR